MADKHPAITLYTAQSQFVVDTLKEEGICFSKKAYIERKYGESAAIFTTAYTWFAKEAAKYLAKPDDAEYPYWLFTQPENVGHSGSGRLLTFHVPMDEAIFFDMYDWNQILALRYMGDTPADEQQFRNKLAERGIKQESDAVLTNFYPDLKQEVQASWHQLFRHHEAIKNGSDTQVEAVQAATWCLKKEWLED